MRLIYIALSVLCIPIIGCKSDEPLAEVNEPPAADDTIVIEQLPTEDNAVIEPPEYQLPDIPIINSTYTLRASGSKHIERSRFDGYDLDDVGLKRLNDKQLEIVNRTPRYIFNPLIKVNSQVFKVDHLLMPFESVTVITPDGFSNISSALFVEEQPFFKAHIRGYIDIDENNDKYALPNTQNVEQYEKEIRGLKNVFNNYQFNYEFTPFIEEYMSNLNTRSVRKESEWCEFHQAYHKSSYQPSGNDYVHFSASDTSKTTDKQLSMLVHKPSANYGMLTKEYNGVATIGDGWLVVRDYRLFTGSEIAPKTTFFHEKMHNHGFLHQGGMTYGYPSQTGTFVSNNWENSFYVDGEVEQQTPTLAVEYDLVEQSSFSELRFGFIDKQSDANSSRKINRFMILLTDNLSLKKAEVLIGSERTLIDANRIGENGRSYYFDSIPSISAAGLNEINTTDYLDKLLITLDKPSDPKSAETSSPASIVLIAGDSSDFKQQANIMLNYPETMGYQTPEGQYIYLDKSTQYNPESGEYIRAYKGYTPDEAVQYCADKGRSLGVLKPFASKEMMALQNKYQMYGSQVGLSYETASPVAISVPTSYRPHLIKEVDRGVVIVCE